MWFYSFGEKTSPCPVHPLGAMAPRFLGCWKLCACITAVGVRVFYYKPFSSGPDLHSSLALLSHWSTLWSRCPYLGVFCEWSHGTRGPCLLSFRVTFSRFTQPCLWLNNIPLLWTGYVVGIYSAVAKFWVVAILGCVNSYSECSHLGAFVDMCFHFSWVSAWGRIVGRMGNCMSEELPNCSLEQCAVLHSRQQCMSSAVSWPLIWVFKAGISGLWAHASQLCLCFHRDADSGPLHMHLLAICMSSGRETTSDSLLAFKWVASLFIVVSSLSILDASPYWMSDLQIHPSVLWAVIMLSRSMKGLQFIKSSLPTPNSSPMAQAF